MDGVAGSTSLRHALSLSSSSAACGVTARAWIDARRCAPSALYSGDVSLKRLMHIA